MTVFEHELPQDQPGCLKVLAYAAGGVALLLFITLASMALHHMVGQVLAGG